MQANNIRIAKNNTFEGKPMMNDYLLQKRIERMNNPKKSMRKDNWWKKSVREDLTDEDYFLMHQKAREISRKALIKENRILDNLSEKERLQKNNEVDRMLISSLHAKLELIQGL